MHRRFVVCLAVLCMAVPALAFAAGNPGTKKGASSAKHAPIKAQKSVTHGSVTVEGKRIGYTATAGTIILKNRKGKPTGSMFYVAYVKDGVKNESQCWPIT